MILMWLSACAQSGKAPLDTADPAPAGPVATVNAGEVLVAEVMFDPSFVDGDLGEWIEVRNVSGADVDLQGVVVQDDDDAGFVIDRALPLAAGGAVVLGPSADTSVNGGVPVDFAYSIDAVKLGNEGDAITLVANGVAIDTFTWDATVFAVAEGSALQLAPAVTDPADNDAVSAWCLATSPYGAGDFGTPGADNTPCG